tara:strand:- start:110 stop:475 length:366 start_codon:yes stop_codon:yes gene_type:complete
MLKTEITLQGQLLLGVPKELAIKVANDICTNIALWGEADVKKQLYQPKHGYKTGNLKQSIRGHLVRNFHAEIDPQNVAYAIYVEKGHRSFSGYHMFANTRKRIGKMNWRKMVDRVIKRRLI